MGTIQTDEVTGASFTIVEEGDPDDILLADPEPSVEPEPKDEPKAEPSPEPKATAPVRKSSRQAEPAVKVQVITREMAAATPEPEAAADDELTDEEADELEKQLDGLIAVEVARQVKEATARVQSAKDLELAQRDTRLKTVEAELKGMRDKELETQLAELDPEERAIFLDKKALEEEKTRVMALVDEVDEYYKGKLVDLLVTDYGSYGVTAEDLSGIDDPDEIEAYCERAKSIYEKILARTGVSPAAAAAAAEAAPAPVPSRVPAGASAPTDIGGESPALGPSRKPAEGTGPEAAAETFNSLPWETVRV